jgi:hypothetical protein
LRRGPIQSKVRVSLGLEDLLYDIERDGEVGNNDDLFIGMLEYLEEHLVEGEQFAWLISGRLNLFGISD